MRCGKTELELSRVRFVDAKDGSCRYVPVVDVTVRGETFSRMFREDGDEGMKRFLEGLEGMSEDGFVSSMGFVFPCGEEREEVQRMTDEDDGSGRELSARSEAEFWKGELSEWIRVLNMVPGLGFSAERFVPFGIRELRFDISGSGGVPDCPFACICPNESELVAWISGELRKLRWGGPDGTVFRMSDFLPEFSSRRELEMKLALRGCADGQP